MHVRDVVKGKLYVLGNPPRDLVVPIRRSQKQGLIVIRNILTLETDGSVTEDSRKYVSFEGERELNELYPASDEQIITFLSRLNYGKSHDASKALFEDYMRYLVSDCDVPKKTVSRILKLRHAC